VGSNVELQSAFKVFLEDFPGDMWMTITFRRALSEATAKKRLKYFFKHLNTPQEIFFDKFVRLWAFYENNIGNDGVHIHALIGGIKPELANALQDKCHIVFGESKVVGKHQGVTSYLGRKYNTSSLNNFDLLHINSKLR
jgi:hypothetical protein